MRTRILIGAGLAVALAGAIWCFHLAGVGAELWRRLGHDGWRLRPRHTAIWAASRPANASHGTVPPSPKSTIPAL